MTASPGLLDLVFVWRGTEILHPTSKRQCCQHGQARALVVVACSQSCYQSQTKLNLATEFKRGWDSSAGSVYDWKTIAILTLVRIPFAAIFFFLSFFSFFFSFLFFIQSTSSRDSHTVSVQPPCVIAWSKSVRTLKIPNPGSHTLVWTHENTLHTDSNGWRCSLAAAVPYPGKATRISRKG